MLILTIRTDNPQAEIGLFEDGLKVQYETWPAHRQLAETIHLKIQGLLKSQNKTLHDIKGIAVFEGPGSFTGLRIGLSVANALADSIEIPIVAAKGSDWITSGIERLTSGADQKIVLPHYGSPPNITQAKH